MDAMREGWRWPADRTLVMGIVNVTPDSFSDGGAYRDVEQAVLHGCRLVEEGADWLDVGGESTRPGHVPVTAETECARVLPVIEELARRVRVPISIDTQKATVAKRALEAGAHIVNDIWGGLGDPEMPSVAAVFGAPYIAMHNRNTVYEGDFLAKLREELLQRVEVLRAAGVPEEHIILDPGVGFAKTHEQNLQCIAHLSEIRSLGYPVLLGVSRKSVIGKTLELPVTERVEGTAAAVAIGIAGGADIIRVHDVRAMVRVARMTDALVRVKG